MFQERRRVLHALIVEALEALAGDRLTEQVERLAHHALRGELWAKAGASARRVINSQGTVPHHGADLLAAPGRGGAGTGGLIRLGHQSNRVPWEVMPLY
jgi:hypothetical protein